MNVYKKNIVDMQNNFSHAVSSHTTHSSYFFYFFFFLFIHFFSSYWKILKMNMHNVDVDMMMHCTVVMQKIKRERKLLNYFN
jgi:hypothetical protein